MAKASQNHLELIKVAVSLAQKRTFDHLLYVGDIPLPEEVFRGKPRARKKLVQAVVSEAQRAVGRGHGRPGHPAAQYDLGRPEKLKLALVSASHAGLYAEGDVVVALLSARPVGKPIPFWCQCRPRRGGRGLRFLRTEACSLRFWSAYRPGGHHRRGGLGRPAGGGALRDRRLQQVMEQSRPLSLNPFQGYSEDERNMLSPEV